MIIYQKNIKKKYDGENNAKKSGSTRYTYIFNNTMMMTLVATAVS